MERLINEIKKQVIGKQDEISKMLMCILAGGHILLEDVPGVGKTTIAKAFASILSLDYKRIQMTPDVLASDLTGYYAINPHTGKAQFYEGVAFTHLLLADEINRASSRTQSALLEVMEEKQISIDGHTIKLPAPFHVIATQNPFGTQGTNLLPESQLDRFMICIHLGYPSQDEEIAMLKLKQESIQMINSLTKEELLHLQEQCTQVFIHDELLQYIVTLVQNSRYHPAILHGASPRASIALMKMAKASAFFYHRDYVIPQDIEYIFIDVMRHRIEIKQDYKDNENRQTKEMILTQILHETKKPTSF